MGLGFTTYGATDKNHGTSVQNLIEADRIRENVREIQDGLIQQKETLKTQFKDKYGKEWDDLHFKLISFEPLGIKELTTEKFLAVNW